MKKLKIFADVLFVAAVIITFIVVFTKLAKVPAPPQRGITLNDVTSGLADEMVGAFKNDTRCTDKNMAVWLDRAWMDSVFNIVSAEHGDGLRFYFARNPADGKNTIVITSTFLVRTDTKAESKQDHVDYYDHTDPFFKTKDTLIWSYKPGDLGATLFGKDPCPSTHGGGLISYPFDTTSHTITCAQAYEAVQNFDRKNNQEAINTNSEWFPLWIIKAMEILDDSLNYSPSNHPGRVDGIRIYFARHDAASTSNCKHQDRSAFIIVPTKSALINGKLCDVDCFDIKHNAQDFYKLLKLKTSGFFNVASDGSGGDNAEQCPDNCTGATLP